MSSAHIRILIVKLSSLGDVLHNLPLVWDLREHLPEAQIDWVVEEAYLDLLEPLRSRNGLRGIDRIIPIALRRWRKNLLSLKSWQEFFTFRHSLQAQTYDVVIETQGLLKSALVCAMTKKTPHTVIAGLANATEYSGYEPIARRFYNQAVQVPRQCHAVDRSRWVMSAAFDWPLLQRQQQPPYFYPQAWVEGLIAATQNSISQNYVVFFHATAREAKRWSNKNWITLGQALAKHGLQIILPWGNAAEKVSSELIAKEIDGAVVPTAFSIKEAFAVVAGAQLTIGVDTGLTHLAAVLGRPTIEIYCDSPKWKTEGYWSEAICNLGDLKNPPAVKTVLAVAERLLKASQSALSEQPIDAR